VGWAVVAAAAAGVLAYADRAARFGQFTKMERPGPGYPRPRPFL